MPGPPAKRSSQRRRRNKPRTPTTSAGTGEAVVRPGEPPRTGTGSGVDAWRRYAETLGIDVPAGAKRGDILALVDEHSEGDAGWDPLAREWYRSLANSGQAQFYEPSDWATAKVGAELLSAAVRAVRNGRRGGGTLVERWQALATELLTTEGARRRARIELERASGDEREEAAGVSELDEYRRRRRSG